LSLEGPVAAQIFTTLHSFAPTPAPAYSNSEGASPQGGLVFSGGTLYGTAYAGGSAGNGTVFALNADGSGLRVLHSFTARFAPYYTNSDGAAPSYSMVLSGNTLYGTAFKAGTADNGTTFVLATNGTSFTRLYSFSVTTCDPNNYFPPCGINSDGARPFAVIVSGDMLYGTTWFGGTSAHGAVFAMHTDGTSSANLHSFTAGSGSYPIITNSDGAYPYALVLSGSTLYGTAVFGGRSTNGTIFALGTDGTGFRTLHSFTPTFGSAGVFGGGTNSDGAAPYGLMLSGGTLYGTTFNGGSGGNGTVFALSTNGTGFTTLHAFPPAPSPSYANSDGANSDAGLILSGNTLYGTAVNGGLEGNGTVFALSTDGTGFTTLHSFTATFGSDSGNGDGSTPYSGLVLSGNTLYGTASAGGNVGNGTVFSISLPAPQLSLTAPGTNVVLAWPTNSAGFDFTGYSLQSSPSLAAPVWAVVSQSPVVVNGQLTVTNFVTGSQQFYRLSQ
jgi:uncharacterized repeat protein (TIGR03803 family)